MVQESSHIRSLRDDEKTIASTQKVQYSTVLLIVVNKVEEIGEEKIGDVVTSPRPAYGQTDFLKIIQSIPLKSSTIY